jgi:hypothetical protein
LGAAVVLAVMGPVGLAGATTAVPYTDPNVVGYIGLCNQAGQQITSGNINTVPLAWRAVSSVPAQAPYNNSSRTAILMAYQPIQVLAPGEWSGEQMTASSRYSNPANPMAAATDGDDSLAEFISDFPTKWDNFVQLRMYLGAADEQQYSVHYPALDIQVTGDTWQAVDGGPVNCASGTSESIESILLPSSTTTTVPGTTGHSASTTPTGNTGSTHVTTPTTAASSGAVHTAASAPSGHATSSSDGPLIAALVLAALAALAGLGYLLTRRRRASPPADSAVARTDPSSPSGDPPASRSTEAATAAGSSSSNTTTTTTKGH